MNAPVKIPAEDEIAIRLAHFLNALLVSLDLDAGADAPRDLLRQAQNAGWLGQFVQALKPDGFRALTMLAEAGRQHEAGLAALAAAAKNEGGRA